MVIVLQWANIHICVHIYLQWCVSLPLYTRAHKYLSFVFNCYIFQILCTVLQNWDFISKTLKLSRWLWPEPCSGQSLLTQLQGSKIQQLSLVILMYTSAGWSSPFVSDFISLFQSFNFSQFYTVPSHSKALDLELCWMTHSFKNVIHQLKQRHISRWL